MTILVPEEDVGDGVDDAFRQSMASLSRQLAVRFAEGPRKTPQASEPATPPNALFTFRGRANRLRFLVLTLGALLVEVVLFAALSGEAALAHSSSVVLATAGSLVSLLLAASLVVAAWICVAVGVKRFHDRDKAGWWALIALVPPIGSLWYLIECGVLRGTEGPNKYGDDPSSRY